MVSVDIISDHIARTKENMLEGLCSVCIQERNGSFVEVTRVVLKELFSRLYGLLPWVVAQSLPY